MTGTTGSSRPTSPPAVPSARWDWASHLRLWPVAVGGLALDLWSKHWAFTHLDPHQPTPVIPHLMTFQCSLNAGALFGLGKGWTPLFIAASFLALGFVMFLFVHSTRDRRSLHVALALVLAGALGNLHDRVFVVADVVRCYPDGKASTKAGKVVEQRDGGVRLGLWPDGDDAKWIPAAWRPTVRQQGVVRDFVKMEPEFTIAGRKIQLWPWVFNVADALLVVGVGLLVLNFWWERRAERAAARLGSALEPASP